MVPLVVICSLAQEADVAHLRRYVTALCSTAAVLLLSVAVAFAGSQTADAASSLHHPTASASRNHEGIVTLEVKISGKTNGGACKIVFVTAKAAKPGYRVCIAKTKSGKFTNDGTWTLRTAKKYSKSTIEWKIVDPTGGTEYGPRTTKVTV